MNKVTKAYVRVAARGVALLALVYIISFISLVIAISWLSIDVSDTAATYAIYALCILVGWKFGSWAMEPLHGAKRL